MAEALAAAAAEEAVAIVALDEQADWIDSLDKRLSIFDWLRDEQGEVVAVAVGRIPVEEMPDHPALAHAAEGSRTMSWTPGSWRSRPAKQLPHYPDPLALANVESRLASAPPLASVADIKRLTARLAEAAAGRAFLLQGGDCAESFAEFGANKVRTIFNLLLQMEAMLAADGRNHIVPLARIAGQFAKPRSAATETIGDTHPALLSRRHRQRPRLRCAQPHARPRAHAAGLAPVEGDAGADQGLLGGRLCRPRRDRPQRARAPRPARRAPARRRPGGPGVDVFTSHEGLLLNYEQALTRWDEESESWWATSGHLLWIGDRTRQLDGAHVEYASGVRNSIGLKCGPSLGADELLRLIERLDPDNVPGRLVLIGRFGARETGRHLPALMQATRQAGKPGAVDGRSDARQHRRRRRRSRPASSATSSRK